MTTVPFGTLLLTETYKQLGAPYQRGAAGPDSLDCSGLVEYKTPP